MTPAEQLNLADCEVQPKSKDALNWLGPREGHGRAAMSVLLSVKIVADDPKGRVCGACHAAILPCTIYVIAQEPPDKPQYLCRPCLTLRWPRLAAVLSDAPDAGYPLARWLDPPKPALRRA